MRKLSWCNNCKENSVFIKAYIYKSKKYEDTCLKRVEYCLNRGCGYKQELPPLKEGLELGKVWIEEAEAITPKQMELFKCELLNLIKK